ncbi:MAG TPA: glycoside hydrolase family 15 protein [Acidobacteriaceae bacterium]|jgi:GH15 family glucan-1,4-alpha-glucosidase
MEFHPIEDYGVIGNMRSIALVGTHGSIDFFCFPRFDSPSVFAALLDPEKGGFFCIQPELDGENSKQLYLPDTNVLVTRFLSDNGIAEITDFMPILGDDVPNQLIRSVSVIQGSITFMLECCPRFDYARRKHTVIRRGDAVVFHPEGTGILPMVLQASIPLDVKGDGVMTRFALKEGEQRVFLFSEDCAEMETPLDEQLMKQRFEETCDFWHKWSGKSRYSGRWRETVNRSALTLKLMQDHQYGSFIAAPTFGLPEHPGGERNWDYRYTWLRDSSFALYAMMRLGYVDEAQQFKEWLASLLDYDAEQGPLQVLYGIDGRHEVPEETLDHLRGYMDSRPVRIGNAAYSQLQLDIYGEMMDAAYLSNKYGEAVSHDGWLAMKRMLEWLSKNWNRPDDGIWEVRGGRQHFLHSRLMCWVAFDRAIRLAEKRSLPGPLDWMYKSRDAIADDIHDHFWSEERQSFVQRLGSNDLDAAVLLMPLMRFISPTDPRWLSTLKAIEEELTVDTLVYRYKPETGVDGLAGSEGAFTACSFWFIECLARSGQLDKARLLFEKMLGYANHVGLYSEELGRSGQHLGNYPQALTHLALISAATYLDRALSGSLPTWR